MSEKPTWHVEKTRGHVKFWIDNQGFTIYSRSENTPNDEHKLLLDFFEAAITQALNKLSPQ